MEGQKARADGGEPSGCFAVFRQPYARMEIFHRDAQLKNRLREDPAGRCRAWGRGKKARERGQPPGRVV